MCANWRLQVVMSAHHAEKSCLSPRQEKPGMLGLMQQHWRQQLLIIIQKKFTPDFCRLPPATSCVHHSAFWIKSSIGFTKECTHKSWFLSKGYLIVYVLPKIQRRQLNRCENCPAQIVKVCVAIVRVFPRISQAHRVVAVPSDNNEQKKLHCASEVIPWKKSNASLKTENMISKDSFREVCFCFS